MTGYGIHPARFPTQRACEKEMKSHGAGEAPASVVARFASAGRYFSSLGVVLAGIAAVACGRDHGPPPPMGAAPDPSALSKTEVSARNNAHSALRTKVSV